MSNIEAKLKELLKALVSDEIEFDDFVKDYMESYVTAIKKAFEGAGYIQIPQAEVVTRWERGSKPEIFMVNGKEVMTGKEWYSRFEKELQNIPDNPRHRQLDEYAQYFGEDSSQYKDLQSSILAQNIDEAAKRASGLTN